MPEHVLTTRELNRATLARQMLFERESLTVPEAISRLVGLQAQLAVAPYVGLWTRLRGFQRDDLAQLIEDRTIVKATLMRSTLHLFTAADYLLLRGTLQPVLTQAWESIVKRRQGVLDVDALVTAARQFIAEAPRTFAEITTMLTDLMPDTDPGSMRYGVRTHLPLVQVPTDTRWSYPGNPRFALADSWLGKSIPEDEKVRELVLRYLAAFGPATTADIQTWSGLTGLKDIMKTLKPELQVYQDEKKRELFDLPELPLPDGDMPMPERFLPEFDNLLLSHKDRTRIVADAYRKQVYLPGLRVAATILVDGFVRGVWKVEKKKGSATLRIEPFEPLTKQNRTTLTAEGEKLVRFIEPDAKAYEIHFVAE